jgi:hypothetical protein
MNADANIILAGVGVIILGIVCGALAFGERDVAASASGEAEEISLRDLLTRGPDGNPYVIVKDFKLQSNFVYEGGVTSWKAVWIPVKPTTPLKRNQKSDDALFYSTRIGNEKEIDERLNQPKVPALVTNRISALDSKARGILERKYPGMDFNTCLILHEGREPASGFKVFGLGFLAIVGFLGGSGIIAYAFIIRPKGKIKKKRRRRRDEDSAD